MPSARPTTIEQETLSQLTASSFGRRFSVVRTLGVGSTGAVLEVVDRVFTEQRLAVKILHRHLLANAEIAARFRNEVLLTRQLSHPNIVRFYDFEDLDDNLAYLSMELIRGCTLKTVLDKYLNGPNRVTKVVEIVSQLLQGLHHAHSRSVLHRDLNLDNVLIDGSGTIKLTDFGLAHALDISTGLTRTGDAVGSPAYMAPEQFTRGELTPATDLYSLGIVAFELLTGRLPFNSESFYLLAKDHLSTPLPIQQLEQAMVPSWLSDLIGRMTAKVQSERPASAGEALESLLAHTHPTSEVRAQLGVSALEHWQSAHSPGVARSTRLLAHLLWASCVFLVPLFVLRFPHAQQRLLATIWELELAIGKRLPLLELYSPAPSTSLLDHQTLVDAINRSDVIAIMAWCSIREYSARSDADGNRISHLLAIKPELMVWAAPCLLPMIYDHPNKKGETPLIVAARGGFAESAEALINQGFQVDAIDATGQTALSIAIASRNVSLIRAFAKAPIRAISKSLDNIPIVRAIETGDEDVVAEVLQLGCNVDQRDRQGRSALMLALNREHPHAEVLVTQLLNAGADLHARDNSGNSVLQYAQASNFEALLSARLAAPTVADGR